MCFVGNLTAVTHNQWVDAELAWQKEKYPKLKLLRDRIVSDESTQVAYEKTLELIKTYGDELKGIIGSSASTAPGAGIAVAEKRMQDKIAVVGTGTPQMASAGLEDGSVKVVSIWDPVKVGYACAWIAREILKGGEIKDGMEVPQLGKITIKGKVIYGRRKRNLGYNKRQLQGLSLFLTVPKRMLAVTVTGCARSAAGYISRVKSTIRIIIAD